MRINRRFFGRPVAAGKQHKSPKRRRLSSRIRVFESVEQRNLLTFLTLNLFDFKLDWTWPAPADVHQAVEAHVADMGLQLQTQEAPQGEPPDIESEQIPDTESLQTQIEATSFSLQFVVPCTDPNHSWYHSRLHGIRLTQQDDPELPSISPPPPQRHGVNIFTVGIDSASVSGIDSETLDFLIENRGTHTVQDALFPGIDLTGYDLSHAELIGTLDVVELRSSQPRWEIDADGQQSLVWSSGSLQFTSVQVTHLDLVDVDQIQPGERQIGHETKGNAKQPSTTPPNYYFSPTILDSVDSYFSSADSMTMPLYDMPGPLTEESTSLHGDRSSQNSMKVFDSTQTQQDSSAVVGPALSLTHGTVGPRQHGNLNPVLPSPAGEARSASPSNLPRIISAIPQNSIGGELESRVQHDHAPLGQSPLITTLRPDWSVGKPADTISDHELELDEVNSQVDASFSEDPAVVRITVSPTTDAYQGITEVLSEAAWTTASMFEGLPVEEPWATMSEPTTSRKTDGKNIGSENREHRISATIPGDDLVDIGMLPGQFKGNALLESRETLVALSPSYMTGSYASIRRMEFADPAAVARRRAIANDASDNRRDQGTRHHGQAPVSENREERTVLEESNSFSLHWMNLALLTASGLVVYASRDRDVEDGTQHTLSSRIFGRKKHNKDSNRLS